MNKCKYSKVFQGRMRDLDKMNKEVFALGNNTKHFIKDRSLLKEIGCKMNSKLPDKLL